MRGPRDEAVYHSFYVCHTLPYCEGPFKRSAGEATPTPAAPSRVLRHGRCHAVQVPSSRTGPCSFFFFLETFKIKSGSGAMLFKTFEGVGDIFSKFLNMVGGGDGQCHVLRDLCKIKPALVLGGEVHG